jgi:hypothetical protein
MVTALELVMGPGFFLETSRGKPTAKAEAARMGALKAVKGYLPFSFCQ